MAPSLPFEIVAKIIENTYHLQMDPPKVDIETLSACAAVCKRWCSFTRRLLFFKVSAAREDQASSLKDFYILAGPGGLGTCIRSLDLLAHSGTSELDFITALSYCPNLYELRLLALGDDPGLSDLEVVRLKALRLKIRALSLTLHDIPRQLSLLCQLMAIWPSIQFLTLSMLPGYTAPLPEGRPPFSLYGLTIHTYRLFPEPIMRWLLPPIPAGQKGSLRILSFTTEADQDLHALMEYMPHVRSLRIQLHYPLPQGFLQRCSALQELVLDISDDTGGLGLEALVPPVTIEHLRILGLHSTEFEPFAMALMRSKLPRLRRVSVNAYTAAPFKFDSYVDLPKVCSDRGVALVPGSRAAWTWTSEYPVPVDHFPRERTIENLYRMNTSG